MTVGVNNGSGTFAGSITDSGRLRIDKVGTGTWTLTGSGAIGGYLAVDDGKLAISGNGSLGVARGGIVYTGLELSGNALLQVTGANFGLSGSSAAAPASVTISGNAHLDVGPSLDVSDATITQSGGRVSADSVYLAKGDFSRTTYNLGGGTLAPVNLYVGYGGNAIVNQTGGSIVADQYSLGYFSLDTVNAGVVNQSAGSVGINDGRTFYVGYYGNATYYLGGTGTITSP